MRPLALIALAAFAATPASAEIRELGPGRFLCEAEAGRSVRRDVSDIFSGFRMAARIRLLEVAPEAGWSTRAGLVFELEGGERAAISVVAPPDSPDKLWVALDPPGSVQPQAMAEYRRGRLVEITGAMTRGAVFARSGNERGQIYVGDARLAGRAITCSGGRFEIELTSEPRPSRRY